MKQLLLNLLISAIALQIFGACAKLPDNTGQPTTFALENFADTTINRQWAKHLEEHNGQSAFLPLVEGLDAFSARALLAHKAEKTIDAQYYLLHDDTVGLLFIDMLVKAADRGVRVRLLLDDMDLEGKDFNLVVLDSHENIEVRLFNPFGRNTGRTLQFLTGFGKQTRRAHNKSFTVDNIATIIGGRNIGNEYFDADPTFAFHDLDVMAIGPIAQEVSGSFDQYWNDPLSFPVTLIADKLPNKEQKKAITDGFNEFISKQQDSIYIQNLRQSNLIQSMLGQSLEFFWGNGVVLADSPDKLRTSTEDDTYHLSKKLAPFRGNLQKELLVISPYFIPGKPGVEYFKYLRDRGVTVKILTNSLSSTDVPIVHSGYAKYRRDLLKIGVELYEFNKNYSNGQPKGKENSEISDSKSSLHAKAFVIDRQHIFIGSLNLDPRSVIQNTEIGVIFRADKLAEEFSSKFGQEIKNSAFKLGLKKGKDGYVRMVWHGNVNGKDVEYYSEPYSSFWERFSAAFLRILPAESQL